ncbi:MAG: sigma-54 dependent transcriptional regulator [Planctomycetota bacterium]|nr:sigma-54 dependent transcriptional regulator [Planctomycetota bacterium]
MNQSPSRGGNAAKTDKRRVLVADDDPVTLRMLTHALNSAGYETVAAKDGREALQLMNADISVALCDLEMPGATGLDCLRHIREHYRDTPVIMVSGKGGIQDAVAAMKQGALDYISKPFDRDELIARVNQACWTAQLARDNRGLREAVNLAATSCDFVARTPVAAQLLRQVAKVATLDSTVLMTGESGTGKTTVARLIHQSGPRAAGPFVTVNCASLPRDLVEAELFGHAKGAFTGAVNDRPGRAEIADGGTLFLDEIGDLPLELQPKLLTFLQDRTFQRIGSNKVYTVDVRLIAATHQDLAAMCQERRFREDLYFRLNVIALHMPALRDRTDDIPELAQQILNRIFRRRGQPPLVCDPAALEALLRHPWRGNVRELENILERASAFCEGEVIRVEDLLFPSSRPSGSSPAAPPPPPTLAGKTLDELEQQAILDTLGACGGNKAEAARRLGISEKSIYNKMKRFDLRPDENPARG